MIKKVIAYIESHYQEPMICKATAPKIFLSSCVPESLFFETEDSFTVLLLKYIDEKKMDDVACYKKAGVSKQTWYKIMNDGAYQPSKNTVIQFAIALELPLQQANKLLESAGFALSKSSKFDLIIEYCLLNHIYNFFEINEILDYFHLPCFQV